jgi:hypothetical protein
MAMSREQAAFFSKYGISTSEELAMAGGVDDGAGMGAGGDAGDGVIRRRRTGLRAVFDWDGSEKGNIRGKINKLPILFKI